MTAIAFYLLSLQAAVLPAQDLVRVDAQSFIQTAVQNGFLTENRDYFARIIFIASPIASLSTTS